MWEKISFFTREEALMEGNDRILLGLSGGADSILLARYLLHLREQGSIRLFALHVNHMLRGEEADRDQKFVEEFCDRWEIPLQVEKRDVTAFARGEKLSLEEAGRVIRHACLEEKAKEWQCDKIALAHHASDLAETMLFRMARGTGPEGLGGILPRSGQKIRPLLCLERKEILAMLLELDQAYVEDSSNEELNYSRNYIRHRILPQLERVNEKAVAHMARLSRQLQEENAYLSRRMEQLYDRNVGFIDLHLKDMSNHGKSNAGIALRMSLNFLRSLDIFEQKEMIRRMLYQAAGRKKDFTATHVDLLLELLDKDEGKQVKLPYALMAMREKYSLLLQPSLMLLPEHYRKDYEEGSKEQSGECRPLAEIPPVESWQETCHEIVLENGFHFLFQMTDPEEFRINKDKKVCAKYFDYDKIKDRLSIRYRQSGDYFVLDASGSRKKLKRYFIDEKIPAERRSRMLLLAEENHVLWLIGDEETRIGRISEAYKVSPDSERILKVSWHE